MGDGRSHDGVEALGLGKWHLHEAVWNGHHLAVHHMRWHGTSTGHQVSSHIYASLGKKDEKSNEQAGLE